MSTSKFKNKSILLAAFFAAFMVSVNSVPVYASHCGYEIFTHEPRLRRPVTQHISNKFTEHRNWFLDTFFEDQVLPALMMFTEQMSAVAMQQTMAVGTFMDAKHQLETQRLLQELQFEAHRDYQPSEDFCWFGTNVRSLAASEQKGRTNAYMLARRQMARQMGEQGMGGAEDGANDKRARWNTFTSTFCDPKDSDWVSTQPAESGLETLCTATSGPYTNADIDYTRFIDNERTLSISNGAGGFDLTNSVFGAGANTQQQGVMALQNNLYGHNILLRAEDKLLKQDDFATDYLELRSIAAKRSVAENSFNAIVGMKSAGTTKLVGGTIPADHPGTFEFLGAIMVELGVPAEEVNDIIGNEPSYYAQLELLAKKIYQNPDFYANLYDKPANVKRKSVALKAIELMVDRAIYESQTRQEMLNSVLLSARLNGPFIDAEAGLTP